MEEESNISQIQSSHVEQEKKKASPYFEQLEFDYSSIIKGSPKRLATVHHALKKQLTFQHTETKVVDEDNTQKLRKVGSILGNRRQSVNAIRWNDEVDDAILSDHQERVEIDRVFNFKYYRVNGNLNSLLRVLNESYLNKMNFERQAKLKKWSRMMEIKNSKRSQKQGQR